MGSPKVQRFIQAVNDGSIQLEEHYTQREARNFEQLLNYRKAEPPSTAYWIRQWWQIHSTGISRKTGRTRSPQTLLANRKVIAPFLEWLWESNLALRSPDCVQPEEIEAYVARYQKRSSGQSLNVYETLRLMLMAFMRMKGCPLKVNVMAEVAKPHHTCRGTREISLEQLQKLRLFILKVPRHGSAADQDHARKRDMALYMIMLESAMRRSAVANLRLSQADWKRKIWTYHDKGKDGLQFYFENIAEALEEYRKVRKFAKPWIRETPENFVWRIAKFNAKQTALGWPTYVPENPERDDVFFRNNAGLPLTPDGVTVITDRWSKYLGQPIRPHMLRKARALLAYEASGTILWQRATCSIIPAWP